MNVVICDDHRLFGESLAIVLEARGHTVVACTAAPAEAVAAAALGNDLAISVGDGNPSGYTYTVREVVDGKVAEIHTSDLGILKKYLTRAFDDPKGPKNLRVSAYKDHPADQLKQVFTACAAAWYTKATFSQTERPKYRTVNVAWLAP